MNAIDVSQMLHALLVLVGGVVCVWLELIVCHSRTCLAAKCKSTVTNILSRVTHESVIKKKAIYAKTQQNTRFPWNLVAYLIEFAFRATSLFI